jgi:dTMP kinase
MYFTLDRALARPAVERELERGHVLIQDRSYYSTLAYQADRLEPRERSALRRLQREVSVEPDRVLWLDVPVETALARVHRRGAPLAPLERRANLERVRRAYVRLARPPRWVRLDASAAPEPLARVAEARIRPWLDRRLRRPGARK